MKSFISLLLISVAFVVGCNKAVEQKIPKDRLVDYLSHLTFQIENFGQNVNRAFDSTNYNPNIDYVKEQNKIMLKMLNELDVPHEPGYLELHNRFLFELKTFDENFDMYCNKSFTDKKIFCREWHKLYSESYSSLKHTIELLKY